MPKVPEDQSPTFSTTSVPGVNFPFRQEFGKVGQGLERLGESTENASATGAEIYRRIQDTQNRSDSANQAAQFKLDNEANMQKLKQASPDGYVYDSHVVDDKGQPVPIYNDDGTRQTIADAHQRWIEQRFTADQDGLENDDAKMMYREKVKPYATDSLLLMQHDTQTMKIKSFDEATDQRVSKIQNALVSKPDLNDLYGSSQQLAIDLKQQEGLLYSGPELEKIVTKAHQEMAGSTVQGAWAQEILNNRQNPGAQSAALEKWISILNGKDPSSVDRKSQGLPILSEMMSPHEKAVELDKMEKFKPEARRADLSNWDWMYSNQVAALKAGRADPNTVLPQLMSDLHSQAVAQDRDAADAGKKMSQAMAAAAFGVATKNMRAQSPDDMDGSAIKAMNSIVAMSHQFAQKGLGLPPNYAGEKERAEVATELKNLIQENVSEREKDFASYLAKPDPQNRQALSSSMAMLSQMDANRPVLLSQKSNASIAQNAFRDADTLAAQMHLPPDKITYLPGEGSGSPMNAGTLSHQLKDPGYNEEQAWNNLKSIKSFSGRWYPQVLNQMISQDKLGAEWGLMSHVGTNMDPRTGAKMVAALRTPENTMNQLVQGGLSDAGQKISDFDGAVAKKVSDWAQGQEQANPFSLGNHNFQAAAQKGVGNLAKMYYSQDPSKGIDEAVQKAYDTFIGDNTHVLKNGPPSAFWGMHATGVVNIPNKLADGTNITDQQADNAIHFMSQKMTAAGITAINPAVPVGADESQRANFPAYVAAHSPRATFFYRNGVPMLGLSYQGARDRELLMTDSKGTVPYGIPLTQAMQNPPQGPSFLQRLQKLSPTDIFNQNPMFGGRTTQSDSVVKGPALTHATDILAYRVLGNHVNPEGPESQELRQALKAGPGGELPKWLNDSQRAQVKQFFDQTRP